MHRATFRRTYIIPAAAAVVLAAAINAAAAATPSPTPESLLAAAALSGSVTDVLSALAQGARLDDPAPDSGRQTPLMAACLRGHTDVVELLLTRGADGTIGERDGYTCLDGAGFQGRGDVARLVLSRFRDRVPVHAHSDGFLPIHRACWGRDPRHADTVSAFLDAGVSPTVRSSSGETPMQLARRAGNERTIAVLAAAIAANGGEREGKRGGGGGEGGGGAGSDTEL